MEELYADVIINISHEAVDRVFQYRVPLLLREEISVGMMVFIPFGKRNKQRQGYVVRLTNEPSYDTTKIKDIVEIDREKMQVEGQLISLAYWMREQYGTTMIQCLKTVLPVKDKMAKKEERKVELSIDKEEAKKLLEEYERKHFHAKVRLLYAVLDGEVAYEKVLNEYKIPLSTIKTMSEQGIIEIHAQRKYRDYEMKEAMETKKHCLNDEQAFACEQFALDYDMGEKNTYLLYGVTGSGKTEVYMEMIAHVIESGRQVILLIPEISLTYQTVSRFQARFGEKIAVVNSKMSKGERFDQFEKAKKGEIQIMIGPRSALFTPFPNLGLIIIDEEHESAYKSETSPKYHAREVARQRAKLCGCSLVLGSATPSIESYTKAKSGEYKLLLLTRRVNEEEICLPKVHTIDLREELKLGNRSMFSIKLQQLMRDRLEKKEQIMLFINRRGFAGFVSCRSCGYVLKCPHCDVSMTYHANVQGLKCHYCGYEAAMPKLCPECKSPYIAAFGLGTQKVELAVRNLFPEAKIARMDFDTTRKKSSYEQLLSAFAKGEIDILIGTQMIVKGHDFPNVTLMGMIAADMSLNAGDYRASERTFQLLVQAAGRAGRGQKEGEVVIQSYTPTHYAIVAAANQNYEEFYMQEMAYRSLLKYPPICHMLVVFVMSIEQEEGMQFLEWFKRALEPFCVQEGLAIIGPSEASLARIKDWYRFVLYLKHEDEILLREVKRRLERKMEKMQLKKSIQVFFDFDPMAVI